jgi:hypothetical protein
MRQFNIVIVVVAFFILGNQEVTAQEKRLIQYSGIVVSNDSAATPVSFATIYNRSIKLGSVANYQGFFSFAARVGDTIEVTSVGYSKGITVVPDIPDNQSYTAIIFLQPEIKLLPEQRVYPWFSKQQFRDAFVHLDIPDDDIERARKNLNADKLKELGETIVDANLNARQTLSNYSSTYYYQGQYQPQAILSPTAWMQFFDALKNGQYKKSP